MLNEDLKKTGLLEICCGRTKQEVDFKYTSHSYEQLRSIAMQYSYKKRADKQKPKTADGMDVSELVEKINEDLKQANEFMSKQGWGKGGDPTKLNSDKDENQEKAIGDI